MGNIIRIKAHDGSLVEFVDEIIGQGGMKDVYFSPDKSYVVAFYRSPQDFNARERLENIVGIYRQRIFDQAGGDYWRHLFCWPEKIVEWKGMLGITCPTYPKHFFFSSGNLQGREKEGKWFASAKLRNKFLPASEKGTWLTHLHMCLKIARAVRRKHAAGLAHSDLSYKNVLVDPTTGSAIIIDIDSLVVPGKFPPDVLGTPDFIAPEVLETQSLPCSDPRKRVPSIQTDRHALSVLIYQYLLYRHPLRGGKVFSLDEKEDELLGMGSQALFIEHPTDTSNRPKVADLHPSELPQGDVSKLPYSICGPYLKDLFDKAFITGLHAPEKRPTADEWEHALLKTTDLVQPCSNPSCEAKWYVFDNTQHPRCPFCTTPYRGVLPILNLYYSPKSGNFKPENYRLMVYDKQSLYMWHVNRFVVPNEKLKPELRTPVGDFHFYNGQWILVNRSLTGMKDISAKKDIPVGGHVELIDGKQILLSSEPGGRLVVVQLVTNP